MANIKWNKDEYGEWILKYNGIEVKFITPTQKENLEKILKEIK